MEIADSKTMNKLIEQQDHLLMQYEHAGGYKFRADTEAVLHGLGFHQINLINPLGNFQVDKKTVSVLPKHCLENAIYFF